MKTTVTEEYEDGQLVRRTTVTDGQPASGGYVTGPWHPAVWAPACVCHEPWSSVLPRTCPAHPYLYGPTVSGSTITVSADTSASPQQLADDIAWELRTT